MLSRTQKRIFIGGIYVLILAVIVGGTLYLKYRPTCSDGIQNGQEEGVDCGTIACGQACVSPVQALIIQSTQLIKTPAGDYDGFIKVYNPNIEYGVADATFQLVIGGEPSSVSYDFYMLPGQTKNLVLTSVKGIPDGYAVYPVIKSVDWQKVTSVQDINFIVTREAVTPGNNQTAYQAVVTNNTNFDFDTIDVSMVVTDASGAIIATNKTNFQTFLSQESRSVKVVWPFVLPADARIQIEVGTNVFNNANFLKRNGTQEKFQQYY